MRLIISFALVAAGGISGVLLARTGTVTPLGVTGILASVALVLMGVGVALTAQARA